MANSFKVHVLALLLLVSVSKCSAQSNVTLPSPSLLTSLEVRVLYYASQEDVGLSSNVNVSQLLSKLQTLNPHNYTKQCSLNFTYRYLPDDFNFTFVWNEFQYANTFQPMIIAGSQFWLVSNINQEIGADYVAVYEQPATITANLVIPALQNILLELSTLAASRGISVPTASMNLTLIFDESVDLQFLTTLIGQLSGVSQFRLWTLYCPQLTSANAEQYVSNLLTASGIHFVIASAATAVNIIGELTLESYTDYDFYNKVYYSNSDSNMDLWLFYNLTSFSRAVLDATFFQLVPAMVGHLEAIDPTYVPDFCYSFYNSKKPEANSQFSNPANNPQLTWNPSAPLAGGMTQNQLRECEFALWLYSYYNQYCTINQNKAAENFTFPPFSDVTIAASSGNLTYDPVSGLRTSSKLIWRVGLTSDFDYAHGELQVVDNVLLNYTSYTAVNTLCQYSFNCPDSNPLIDVTVSVPNLPPFYFVDHTTNTTYGYYYQITQLMATQFNWNVTYYTTDAVNFVGDWTGPTNSYTLNLTTGVVNALNSEADIAIGPLLYSAEQSSFAIYSTPVITSPFSVLMLQPNPPIPWGTGIVWIFTTPFEYTQWIMFAASIAFLSLMLTFIDNIAPNRFRFHLVRSIYYITARGVQGMAGISPNRWPARLMIIFWGFTTLIFVQSYTANLTSTTIYQQNEDNEEPNTINKLILSDMVLGTVNNSLIQLYLSKQNDSIGKMIYSTLSYNVQSIQDGIREIYARNGTIYQPFGFLYLQSVNDYYANQSCGELVSQPVFNSVELFFALPDSAFPKVSISSLNSFINTNLLNFVSIFTNTGSYAVNFPPLRTCAASDWLNSLSNVLDGNSVDSSVFSVVTLIGPFVLIVGGIGLAFGIIIFEFIVESIKKIIKYMIKRQKESAAQSTNETSKQRCNRMCHLVCCICCDVANENAAKKAAKKAAAESTEDGDADADVGESQA